MVSKSGRIGGLVLALVVVVAGCAPSPGAKRSSKKKKAPVPATTTTTVPVPAAPPVVRSMVFPVVGSVSYSDTFGAPRSGGRTHEGQDLMGAKGQVLVAAADGVLTTVRHDQSGLSGNMIRLTDAEGWTYVYIHINNDHPGTDDGANVFEQAFADGVVQGQRVRAGEPIAYLGDSGNAETTAPHLHFELRAPGGAVVNAFPSLQAAAHTSLTAGQVSAAAPIGALDSVGVVAPNTLHVNGWALDATVDSSVKLTVYVDGNPSAYGTAGTSRPDVAALYPGRAGQHGYGFDVPGIVGGAHRVCVIAHNAGDGGGGRRLGCADVAV